MFRVYLCIAVALSLCHIGSGYPPDPLLMLHDFDGKLSIHLGAFDGVSNFVETVSQPFVVNSTNAEFKGSFVFTGDEGQRLLYVGRNESAVSDDLYISDGTQAGTRVLETFDDSGSSDVGGFVSSGSYAYFLVNYPDVPKTKIYKTNGITVDWVVYQSTTSTDFVAQTNTPVLLFNSNLVFACSIVGDSSGQELCKTGISQGSQVSIAHDITQSSDSVSISFLEADGTNLLAVVKKFGETFENLYFFDSSFVKTQKSFFTSDETFKDIEPFDSRVFCSISETSEGTELYEFEGANINLLNAYVNDTGMSPSDFAVVGGALFFRGLNESGTSAVFHIGSGSSAIGTFPQTQKAQHIFALAGTMYITIESDTEVLLYKSDGIADPTLVGSFSAYAFEASLNSSSVKAMYYFVPSFIQTYNIGFMLSPTLKQIIVCDNGLCTQGDALSGTHFLKVPANVSSILGVDEAGKVIYGVDANDNYSRSFTNGLTYESAVLSDVYANLGSKVQATFPKILENVELMSLYSEPWDQLQITDGVNTWGPTKAGLSVKETSSQTWTHRISWNCTCASST
eukprot:Nk52_evm18s805 gene=Nk52_evmTU18s805